MRASAALAWASERSGSTVMKAFRSLYLLMRSRNTRVSSTLEISLRRRARDSSATVLLNISLNHREGAGAVQGRTGCGAEDAKDAKKGGNGASRRINKAFYLYSSLHSLRLCGVSYSITLGTRKDAKRAKMNI